MRGLLLAFVLLWGAPSFAMGAKFPPVLYIGDSQSCQTFGRLMDQKLRKSSGDRATTRAMWGSAPHSYYDGSSTTDGYFEHDPGKSPVRGKVIPIPSFPALMEQARPGLVVVELGANLDWAIDQPEFIRTSIGRMIDDIKAKGARCFWIGPAASRARPRYQELNALVAAAVGDRCLYFDSIPLTPYPATGGDGLHFDSLGLKGIRIGHRWADGAFERLEECMSRLDRRQELGAECAGL